MTENPFTSPESGTLGALRECTDPDWLLKQLARLKWLAAVSGVTLAAVPFVMKASAGKHALDLTPFVGTALLSSSIAFLIVLGVLAHRLGRSWIITCFFAQIIFPIGFLVSYFVMRRAVKRAIAASLG